MELSYNPHEAEQITAGIARVIGNISQSIARNRGSWINTNILLRIKLLFINKMASVVSHFIIGSVRLINMLAVVLERIVGAF